MLHFSIPSVTKVNFTMFHCKLSQTW